MVALAALVLVAAGAGSWAGVYFAGAGADRSQTGPVATDTQSPADQATATPTRVGETPAAPATSDENPPPEQDFATLWEEVSSGVVEVRASGCFQAVGGSGFLVEDGYVVTNAHVVADAVEVEVGGRGTATSAAVVGVDRERDLALLDPATPLDGHRFEFSDTAPEVGAEVAALGYPLDAGDATMTRGAVSADQRSLDGLATPVLQTDTSINFGNSGGPLIDRRGEVIGVVVGKRLWATPDVAAEGIGYAIPGDVAADRTGSFAAQPQPQPAQDCGRAAPAPAGSQPVTEAIAATLVDYYEGINWGDYELAWNQLTPAFQDRLGSLQSFADGNRTSYIVDVRPGRMRQSGAGVWRLEVAFTSLQDPSHGPQGEGCTEWNLRYRFVRADGAWLIDAAEPVTGQGHRPCG